MKELKLSHVHTIVASCIAYVIQAVINNFMPLLFLTFRSEFGLSLGKISALIGINFFTQLVMDLVMTKLADRIGYRASVLLGHIFSCIGLLGLAFLPDMLGNKFAGLVICTIAAAIGGGIIEVLISPIVEAAPTENKAGAISLLHSFYCWGQMLVIIFTTIFFAIVGIKNWRIMAAIWAFLPAVNMLYFVFVPIKKPVEKEESLKATDLLAAPAFWVLFVLMLCAGASELSMAQWVSAFAESALNVPKAVGDLFGPCFFAACMGIARLLYSMFSSKVKLQRSMVYSAALCVFAYILTIVSGNPVCSLIGVGLVGFSVGIMWPGTISLASAKIPMGGTALFALLAFAGDIGCTVGPTLVGVVAGAAKDNLKIGLVVGIIFPLIIMITLLSVNKKLARKISRNRGVWLAVVAAIVLIALSVCLKGCGKEQKNPETQPTPTPIALSETKAPVPTEAPKGEDTPAPLATETPTPVPTEGTEPEATATPEPTNTPAPTATPAATDEFPEGKIKDVNKTVYTTSDLNVRKGPYKTYDKLMIAKKGEALTVTGECSNGWLRIVREGKVGYVSGDYTTEKAPDATPTPTPTVKATATPEPTQAPEATATPVPTQAPEATATPVPTQVPEATATPAPAEIPSAGTSIDEYSGFDGIAYFCYDLNEDVIRYVKNKDTQMQPASLTKMLTALVAVEHMDLSTEIEMPLEAMRWVGYTDADGNAVAAVDKDMSVYGAPAGTVLTLEDWLNVLMLLSAADAADTIAIGVGGSIDNFVEMMNAKAAQLGMDNSNFDNPVGADQSSGFYSTYSTAEDMAKLAAAFMRNSQLRKIVSRTSYTTSTGFAVENTPIKNINLLVSDSAYKSNVFTCTGIKTGYTTDAGQCIAASGKDDNGNEYLVVLLDCKSRKGCAEQAKKMLEYLFINMD